MSPNKLQLQFMLHDNIYRYTKRGTTNNNAILALAVRRIPPAALFRRSRARARQPRRSPRRGLLPGRGGGQLQGRRGGRKEEEEEEGAGGK
jgi:hypothetical protein